MRPVLLFFAAAVLPLVWGWGVNVVLARLWPENASRREGRHRERRLLDPHTDYQI